MGVGFKRARPEAADIGRPKLFGKKPDWEMILVFHKAESRNM
jgi:hypothetical protein